MLAACQLACLAADTVVPAYQCDAHAWPLTGASLADDVVTGRHPVHPGLTAQLVARALPVTEVGGREVSMVGRFGTSRFEYIDAGPTHLGGSDLSLAAWVRLFDYNFGIGGAGFQRVMELGDGPNTEGEFFFGQQGTTSSLAFGLYCAHCGVARAPGWLVCQSPAGVWRVDEWLHLGVALSQEQATLYRDGEAVASCRADMRPVRATRTYTFLGKSFHVEHANFLGYMQHVRIFTRALGGAWMRALAEGGEPAPGPVCSAQPQADTRDGSRHARGHQGRARPREPALVPVSRTSVEAQEPSNPTGSRGPRRDAAGRPRGGGRAGVIALIACALAAIGGCVLLLARRRPADRRPPPGQYRHMAEDEGEVPSPSAASMASLPLEPGSPLPLPAALELAPVRTLRAPEDAAGDGRHGSDELRERRQQQQGLLDEDSTAALGLAAAHATAAVGDDDGQPTLLLSSPLTSAGGSRSHQQQQQVSVVASV